MTMSGLLASGFTYGQTNTDNDKINATALVATAITVTPGNNLDFKTIMPGVTKTIGFTNNVTGNAEGTETTGKFTIGKGANTLVQLSLSAPSVLDGPGADININYTYQLSGQTAVAPISSFPFTVAKTGATADYWSATSFSFDLGGTVTPATDQLTGTYTAEVTLTATYN